MESQIVDRAAARAALLAKYRDPSRPPFPGAVAMTCTECQTHILWVNPPLPANGRTLCKTCGSGSS